MAKPAKKFSELGNKYAKKDLERLGLFSEMPCMNGKGYVSPFPKPRPDKGRNMYAEGAKMKTGKQDCYFDKEFKRIFDGEAIKGRGRKPKPSAFKNISTAPFRPPGYTKWHSTPGDNYGTFTDKMEAFSGKLRPHAPYKKEPPNCLTKPGRKGGPGYANICLNPYPEHSIERYGLKAKYKEYGKLLDGPLRNIHFPQPYFGPDPYLDLKPGPTYVRPKETFVKVIPPGKIVPNGPAKWPGGCHAGCFDKFPEYKSDRPLKVSKVLRKALYGPFHPQSYGEKTYYTCSVTNENLRFRMNTENYQSYQTKFIQHLVH